jgi:hypothetical protein
LGAFACPGLDVVLQLQVGALEYDNAVAGVLKDLAFKLKMGSSQFERLLEDATRQLFLHRLKLVIQGRKFILGLFQGVVSPRDLVLLDVG